MVKAPPTPKGFRDILPELAKKRREVINTISSVLEESGFSPMETPTIEFAETLKGKYGEEEKLIYEFTDRGERQLAMRYDLTVPLARFVASNLSLIERGPFRRYQVGQVFRGEKPQKGRFREFTQLDFDIVGSSNPEEDAKIINTVAKCINTLGFEKYKILVNDRDTFTNLSNKFSAGEAFGTTSFDISSDKLPYVIRSIDRLKKIGTEEVENEIMNLGFTMEEAKEILRNIKNAEKSENIKKIESFLSKEALEKYQFMGSLARGLDYYTGMIFEVEIEGYGTSVAGGGRYDNLIGMFAKKDIPAVGGSFGIDRLIEALG
jgi:histidyl-tRNA synthetase